MVDIFHLGIKALIQNKKGEILLLKVNPEVLGGNKYGAYWDIPGGRVQKSDTIEETLKREVEEETGINKIKNINRITTVVSNIRIPQNEGDVGLILSIYSCEVDFDGKLELSDEHSKHKWFDPQEAARLLKVKYPPEFTQKISELQV